MVAIQKRYKTFTMRDRDLLGYIARPARHRSQPDRCGQHTRHGAVCCRSVGHRLQADPASAMYPHRCAAVPSRRPTLSGNCCSCCWSADKLAQRLALITTIMAAVLTVDELAGVDMFDTQGASPAPRTGPATATALTVIFARTLQVAAGAWPASPSQSMQCSEACCSMQKWPRKPPL